MYETLRCHWLASVTQKVLYVTHFEYQNNTTLLCGLSFSHKRSPESAFLKAQLAVLIPQPSQWRQAVFEPQNKKYAQVENK